MLYKRRNVVERACNQPKNWRGIATRYDKHAVNYRSGVVLGAIVLWLRHLGDAPQPRAERPDRLGPIHPSQPS